MFTKSILIWVIVGIIVLSGVSIFFVKNNKNNMDLPNVEGKLKVINFSGKLEETNEGCFADGECYVVIQGKHITITLGWKQEVVGQVLGVDSLGDLKNNIGRQFEVYAQDKGDDTYTLYGSEGFYIKLIEGENLEGEADPDRMTLGMKKWIWLENSAFTITFKNNGNFLVTTDCNSMIGSYDAHKSKGKLTFSNMISTEIYCENSRESKFLKLLQNTISYQFTSRSQLILDLNDGGTVTFI